MFRCVAKVSGFEEMGEGNFGECGEGGTPERRIGKNWHFPNVKPPPLCSNSVYVQKSDFPMIKYANQRHKSKDEQSESIGFSNSLNSKQEFTIFS